MDSEHRFSLCWIFCVCKVFNNPNQRDISLLGVVPRHQQANYQPHSVFIPSSLVTDTKSRLSKNLCGCLVNPFPSSKMFQNNILLYSHCHIPYRNETSTTSFYTGFLLFCLPSHVPAFLFKNSISYLRKNYLLYRLHFSVSFISLEFATTKDQWHTTFKDCVHRQPVVLVVGGGQRRPFFSSQEIF